MVTVIDMSTGEVIHSCSPARERKIAHENREFEFSLPTLALQEVSPEPQRIEMPPELAQVSLRKFIAQFD